MSPITAMTIIVAGNDGTLGDCGPKLALQVNQIVGALTADDFTVEQLRDWAPRHLTEEGELQAFLADLDAAVEAMEPGVDA